MKAPSMKFPNFVFGAFLLFSCSVLWTSREVVSTDLYLHDSIMGVQIGKEVLDGNRGWALHIGPAYYVLVALGMLGTGVSVAALAVPQILASILVGSASYFFGLRRLPAWLACFYACTVVAVLSGRNPLGAQIISYAMAYNRIAWGLAMAIALPLALAIQYPTRPRVQIIENLLIGLLFGWLIWQKSTMAIILLPLLLSARYFVPKDASASLMWQIAAGSLAIYVAFMLSGFAVTAPFAGLGGSTAKTLLALGVGLVHRLVAPASFAWFAIFAVMFFACGPKQRPWSSAAVVLIGLGLIVPCFQKEVFPMTVTGSLVLGEWLRRRDGVGSALSMTANGLAISYAIVVLLPDVLLDRRALSLGASAYHFNTDIPILSTTRWRTDSKQQAQEVIGGFNSVSQAVKEYLRPGTKITSVGLVSQPFPVLTGMQRAPSTRLWLLDLGNGSNIPNPAIESKEAQAVIIISKPVVNQIAPLDIGFYNKITQPYHSYLQHNYFLAYEGPEIEIWVRMGSESVLRDDSVVPQEPL